MGGAIAMVGTGGMVDAVRPNTIKARTLAGETVLGALVFEFFSPGMPQVLKSADCEFALFDMEHTGLGFETLKMLFAACRGIELSPMVRVPRNEYHFLARALDVGAHGVMVPMVESAEEARRVVEATYYPPQGAARRSLRHRAGRLPRRRRQGQGCRAERSHAGDCADRIGAWTRRG